MKKRKKLFTTIATSLTVIALALGAAAGCGGKADNGGGKTAAPANVKDVYAASVLSGASYLSGAAAEGTVKTLAANAFNAVSVATERPSEFTREKAIELKNGLLTLENAISNRISETVALNDGTGEYAVYEFVMTVSAGSREVAKMYYNETPEAEENDADDIEEDDDIKDDDEKVGEFETSTTLNGVIVYGEKAYTVSGKREMENDGDESEYSVEIKTMTDKNNYVEFCYEVEKEANENSVSYEFKIVNDGVTVQETELEFEEENGKTEVSLKFKKGSVKDAGEFKIVKDDVNANAYRVRYEVNGKKSYITVIKTETGYKFTYSNQFVEEVGFTEDLSPEAEAIQSGI